MGSMELLIRRAQQKQARTVCRSLTPAFPPRQLEPTNPCPTPRQVHELVARPLLSYLAVSRVTSPLTFIRAAPILSFTLGGWHFPTWSQIAGVVCRAVSCTRPAFGLVGKRW